MQKAILNRFVGDRAFYGRVGTIVLPIIVQNTISNVVSLLDNVMVGQVGTLQMSAVAIVNQLLFVVYLCIFGGMAGAGIFATQYAGAGDNDGVRYCFRIKAVVSMAVVLIALGIFLVIPQQLISMYLTDGSGNAELTLGYASSYLRIMLWGLVPFGIAQMYASTLREVGETRLPMYASIAAILVNLVFNYLLIFGHFGFPEMGVDGAAIATVLSRFVEVGIIAIYTHVRQAKYPFIHGAYKSLYVPMSLVKHVTTKGMPLLVNEFLWSSGMAMLMQCYSVRGLDVVAATNISSTVANLFNVVFLSMGNAVAIMVGQSLGANKREEAKDTANKLLAFGVVICVVIGAIMFFLAPLIPHIYNTEEHVRELACQFLRVVAVLMPVFSFSHNCYFTLRSGGKTFITFLFDCVFTWVVSVPVAWALATFTALPIVPLYLAVQSLDLIKAVLGGILISKGIWIQNIVSHT